VQHAVEAVRAVLQDGERRLDDREGDGQEAEQPPGRRSASSLPEHVQPEPHVVVPGIFALPPVVAIKVVLPLARAGRYSPCTTVTYLA
jgi:hypothetical protein